MVDVPGGNSTLEIIGTARFESTSRTSLTGNLQLDSDFTVVEAGATFSGGGELVNIEHRHLMLGDQAGLGVGLENSGILDLNFEGLAQVEVARFEQTSDGRLNVDLAGATPDLYDRILTTGAVRLDGVLDVDAGLFGFNPAANDTFTIIDTLGGVTGAFVTVFPPTLNPGLAMRVVYNPTSVVLQIVGGLPGDYNQNGVVDGADYIVWRNTLGQSGVGLSADGNGNGTVDNGDYRWRNHFGQTAGSGAALSSFGSVSMAVPEPVGASLLLVFGAAIWLSRRQRGLRA
jgi:hypothetical protein